MFSVVLYSMKAKIRISKNIIKRKLIELSLVTMLKIFSMYTYNNTLRVIAPGKTKVL